MTFPPPHTSIRLLGIDGGGTTTEAWLAEPGGHVLGSWNSRAVKRKGGRLQRLLIVHSIPRSVAHFMPLDSL